MLGNVGLTRKLIRVGKRCFSLYCPKNASSIQNFEILKKMGRGKGYHCIYDTDLAAQIASIIKKESKNVDTMIEVNPGIGVISAELAKLFNKVVLIEKRELCLPTLQKLKQTHENIEFAEDKTDFFLFEKFSRVNYFKPPDVLDLLPKSKSSTDIIANIFVVIPIHLDLLITSIITDSAMAMEGIFERGRINWFAVVPERFFKRMEFSRNSYSLRLKFELDLFMDIKTLLEIDGENMFPKYHKSSQTTYLIKLTPKENMREILTGDEIEKYSLFARQTLRKGEMRLILRMEELFPKCGIHLINEGFDMMQRFRDLKAEEFLKLFKLLPNLPDYEYSFWKQFLDSEGYTS